MGSTSVTNMSAGNLILGLLIWAVIFAAYWLPTIVAWRRHVGNLSQIVILNLFLGWTVVGWVVALVWAVKPLERTA